MDINDINNRFTYHAPTPDQINRYTTIRQFARDLAASLDALCPDSRELSLAITHLEEVVFWANAAIARNEKSEGQNQ